MTQTPDRDRSDPLGLRKKKPILANAPRAAAEIQQPPVDNNKGIRWLWGGIGLLCWILALMNQMISGMSRGTPIDRFFQSLGGATGFLIPPLILASLVKWAFAKKPMSPRAYAYLTLTFVGLWGLMLLSPHGEKQGGEF